MATQTDTTVGTGPLQRLKSVLRGPVRTSVSVINKDFQPSMATPSPSGAASHDRRSQDVSSVHEGPTTENPLPPQTFSPSSTAAEAPTPAQEPSSTSSRNRSRRLSSLGMAKVKAFLNSSSSPGVSSPPSPTSRRSTSERTLAELASIHHSEVRLEEGDGDSTYDTTCDSTILQLLPPPHADGVYRPGDCLTGLVTLRASPNGDRKVVSVKSTLRGVRECHVLVPSDESEPLFRQQETPKRREIGFSKVIFWTDRCSIFTEKDIATLSAASETTSTEPLSAQVEFLLPKKLPATWQDDFTEDELARPRRLREKSRLPIDLPPSLDASSIPLGDMQSEETANFLQKASQWVQNTRSDKTRLGKVEYTIEVTVKRQRVGWTGRLGVTKKERLSTTFTVHPHPPFSATVPVAVNTVPAVLPSPSTTSPTARTNRASLSIESRPPPSSGVTDRAQRRRSLQVDVGSLTAPSRDTRLPGSPARDLSDDNLQIITNDRGRQQAWYKHSAVDPSGSVSMELSFPALASISTDIKVPFLLRLSLPRGSRPKTDTVRMSLLRTVTTTTKFGVLKIETAVPMQTPSGQAGVKVEALTRRDDRMRHLPHRLGAEVQIFEGFFMLEGYTVPVRRPCSDASATAGLGMDTSGASIARTSTLVDPSQKTVPSFTFKNLKLSYSLLVQVDIEIPSTSRANAFEEGIGQLAIPTICVANEPTSHSPSAAGQNMTLPPLEPEQLQSSDPAAPTNSSHTTGERSASSELSRLQALPTYSSLYLRDMARRAASESNALEVQREGDGDGDGDEASSTSSEDALEASTELGHSQGGGTVTADTPSSSSQTPRAQSSGCANGSPGQGLGSSLATPSEAQPAVVHPLSPSPSYISQTGFPFSSFNQTPAGGSPTQAGGAPRLPVEAPEEESALETTTPTSREMADNFSDCTTDTLPPGYPISVRTAQGAGSRIGQRVADGAGAGAAVGAGAGAGVSPGSEGSGAALTREMRAIEAYLGARGGRMAGL